MTYCTSHERDAHKRKGFSLIEIIVALSIVAALGTAGFWAFRYLGQVKVTQTRTKLSSLSTGIKQYRFDTNKFPSTLQDLLVKPQGVKKWQGPYVDDEESLNDGWGNPFVYEIAPKGTKPPYQLYSLGDDQSDDAEQISVWDL
jgi:general secretion pathway protein G